MRNAYGWSVVLVLICGSAVFGQRVRPGNPNVRPNTQPVPGAQNGVQNQAHPQQHQGADQQIATMIAACNRNEVEISKFALSKLKSDEAKEIASMLIKDHTEGANKFSKWAGQPANVNVRAADGDVEEGRREEGRRGDEQTRVAPAVAPANPAANPAAAPRVALKPGAGGLDWLAVHQEIAEEGLASCKKELSRYEGKEFDKAFLGHQIGGHLIAVTNLKVLKRHASSELAGEIDSAIETTESHLKKIRDLMEDKKNDDNK